jgi:hypothetical protein
MPQHSHVEDLFQLPATPDPTEEEAEHVSHYNHLRDSPYCAEEREYLNRAYRAASSRGLLDEHFEHRFVENFAARVFELWLAQVLLGWGWPLRPSPSVGQGPDFGVDLDGQRYWIEATAPTAGKEFTNGLPNPRYPDKLRSGQVYSGGFNHTQRCLRYLAALKSKIEQYRRALSRGLVTPGDGYVVAINGALFHDRGSWDGPEPMIPEAVLPFVLPEIVPPRGARVSGPEMLASAPEVSAVLIEPNHIKNRPEVHGHQAGRYWLVVLNEHARVPLRHTHLQNGRVYSNQALVHSYCPDGNQA